MIKRINAIGAPTGTLLAALACMPAQAAEPIPAEAVDSAETEAPALFTGEVEVGARHVSEDSFAFGRYTGLDEEGLYAIGNVHMHFTPGRTDYFHLIGRELGTDARSLLLEYGTQGRYDTFLQYDSLPNLRTDTAQTPFVGAGSDSLSVTPEFRDLDIETRRETVGAGFSYHTSDHTILSLAIKRQTRDGTDVIGGALGRGGGGGGAGFGNPYAALLPEPIDYTEHQLDLRLEQSRQRYQWQLAYHMSLFDNDIPSLSWDNPSSVIGNATGGGGGAPAAQGQLALPPSNQFHQVTLNGAYSLDDTTRLTGLVSSGVMLQDEDYLPFRVGDPVSDLPRTSLDGKVYVHAAGLGLTARPLAPLRLKANYRYDERDNSTPQASYDYFRLDSGVRPGAVVNEPLSYRRHKVDLDADYRFSREVKAGLAYGYRHMRRDNADVERNEEHKVEGRLDLKPMDRLDLTLKAARMERDGSDYQAEAPNQNPLLRKYYLADETQDSLGMRLAWMPVDLLTLGLAADHRTDDYHGTEIGLTDAERNAYTLDLSFVPREDLTLYGFYSWERIESTQLGSEITVPVADWRARFDDRVDTLGAGMQMTGIRGKWDVGLDYAYMKGRGEIDLTSTVSPETQYPQLENDLHSVRVYAQYRMSKQLSLKLSYLYEKYDSTDWALDGYAPDSVTNTLLLGNESDSYDVDVVSLSMKYTF